METVLLDNTKYTKASVLAKQFKYTADYVGQLCRAKKVDARLVGRTWFVNADSLSEHKEKTHQKPVEKTIQHAPLVNQASDIKTGRIDVVAPLKNKTVKLTTSLPNSSRKNFEEFIEQNLSAKIVYRQDGEHLLPPLHKDIASKTTYTPVKQASKIVHSPAKKLEIKPANVSRPALISVTPSRLISAVVPQAPVSHSDEEKRPVLEPMTPVVQNSEVIRIKSSSNAKVAKRLETRPHRLAYSDQDINLGTDTTSQHSSTVGTSSVFLRWSPLLGLMLALVVGFLLLTATSEIFVSGMLSTSKISFEVEQFLLFFLR